MLASSTGWGGPDPGCRLVGANLPGMWKNLFDHCADTGGPVHVHVAASLAECVPATVRARARREGWWQPYRDVVAPPGVPVDGRTWALAAIARVAGPSLEHPRPGALARWSAAMAHGVGPGWPTRVQVTVPIGRELDAGPRLEVVRSRGYDPEATEVLDDKLTVLRPPALVRSLAAVADVATLTDLVVDLVQQRLTTLEEVVADHDRHPCYPNRARVTEVLDRLTAAGRTDSGLELRLRERLVAGGVPLDPGQIQVPCRDGRCIHLDLGIERIRFGIDAVSMRAHSTRSHLRVDARRSNQLAAVDDDWRVLQATWEDLRDDRFMGLVRDVVSAQSMRHLGVSWPD